MTLDLEEVGCLVYKKVADSVFRLGAPKKIKRVEFVRVISLGFLRRTHIIFR